MNFGWEQDFLQGRFYCNSLWHRQVHWTKRSSLSSKLNSSLCVHSLEAGSDKISAELASGSQPELCSGLVYFWALLNQRTHEELPRRRCYNSWKVLVKQVESCFISHWEQSSGWPALQALGPSILGANSCSQEGHPAVLLLAKPWKVEVYLNKNL